MLIDVSRRPVRLIYEECPSGLVIRTLCIRGKADGLLHQEQTQTKQALKTIAPKIRLTQGGLEYIETVLKDRPMYMQEFHDIRTFNGMQRVVRKQREATEPYYCISGHKDQFTDHQNLWRLNFVFGEGPGEHRILTLLDETHSAVLFTVQIPTSVEDVKITTPLERYLRNPEGTAGLWRAVLDEDDEL